MNHRHSLSGFVVAVMLTVIFASVSFSAGGIAVTATDSPTDVGGQIVGQAQSSTTTSKQNTSNVTAAVELDSTNNTTARAVVISKVRLPEGGFIVIHGPEYAEQGVLDGSQIVVSRYFRPGTYRNVSIPVKRGVPGAYSNSSRINLTRANISAIVYKDANNNQHYDFVASLGQNDTPYQRSYLPISDTETVVFEKNVQRVKERTQTEPATVQFNDQRVHHADGASVVVIENVTLPKGGFVVVHDSRYLPPSRNPLDSAIGLSQYLTPGTHRKVIVPLLNGSVNNPQTLIAVPYLDTNGNRRYDYVRSGGETDYQYVARQNGSAVVPNDTAHVIPSTASPPTNTPATPANTPQPTTASPTSTTDTAGTPVSGQSQSHPSASPGILSTIPLWLKIVLPVVIVIIGLSLVSRWL